MKILRTYALVITAIGLAMAGLPSTARAAMATFSSQWLVQNGNFVDQFKWSSTAPVEFILDGQIISNGPITGQINLLLDPTVVRTAVIISGGQTTDYNIGAAGNPIISPNGVVYAGQAGTQQYVAIYGTFPVKAAYSMQSTCGPTSVSFGGTEQINLSFLGLHNPYSGSTVCSFALGGSPNWVSVAIPNAK